MITTAIELPVTSKDPQEVVPFVISLLREKAEKIDFRVDLTVTCTSKTDVIVGLARELPPPALGFRPFGERTLTAAEFLKTLPGPFAMFQGTLTDYVSTKRSLELIEELLKSPSSAIRSTSFMITAREMRWKGSPAGTSGGLQLFDLKALKRANRFSLGGTLDWPGADATSVELKEVLNAVTRATGLPFDKGASVKLPGNNEEWQVRASDMLAGTICFEEAVRKTVEQIERGSVSKRAPNAISRGTAVGKQLDRRGSGRTLKVNFPAVVKKQMKQSLPGLELISSDAEELTFARTSSADTQIVVCVEKSLPKLGKAFTISLGVRTQDGTRFLNANLFKFDGTTDEKMWIYGSSEESAAVVAEALAASAVVLPVFEAQLKLYFDSWPREIPQDLPAAGALTARKALEVGRAAAAKIARGARLIRIGNIPRSLAARDWGFLELTIDGRLTDNAAWRFHFYCPEKDASFEVSIPAVGSICVYDHGEQYCGRVGESYWGALPDDWMDSDAALAIAERMGGEKRRTEGKLFGLLAKLDKTNGGCWEISYLVTDERGRNDLIVRIDATTGEMIEGIQSR